MARSTVYNYLDAYKNDQRTKNKPHGDGRPPKLGTAQEQELCAYLDQHVYRSIVEIIDYIQERYRV